MPADTSGMTSVSRVPMLATAGRLPSAERRALIVRAIAVGLAYAAVSKLIDVVTVFGNSAGASFWPGAGLTVAVLLRRPRAEWPWYLLAVGIGEFCVDMWIGFGAAVAIGWAVANTAEPLTAALLLRRRCGDPPDMGKRGDLVALACAAILLGPLVGSLVGTAVGALFAGDPWLPRLPRWYVGDAMGVLVIAPALLILWPSAPRRPGSNAVVPLLVLTVVACVAVGPWRFSGAAGLPFLVLPVMIVTAMRSGLRGAAGGVLIVAMIVETVTAAGYGPFAEGEGALHGLVVAQMFLAMSAVTAFAVAVLAGELVASTRVEGELRSQALRDSLTGLANRRLLFDRLEHASRRLARRPGMVALLFIDLDAFKAVNDTYGHAAGDRVLVESAVRLRGIVRDHDSIARLGGDEFLILAEDLRDAGDAHKLAERVVAAFDEPFATAGGPIHLTVSVGISTTTAPIDDPQAYLSGADRAMYTAKRAGGHRIATKDPAPECSGALRASGGP